MSEQGEDRPVATGNAYLVEDWDGHRTRFIRQETGELVPCDYCLRVGIVRYLAEDAPLEGQEPDPAVRSLVVCPEDLADIMSWLGDAHSNVAKVTEECGKPMVVDSGDGESGPMLHLIGHCERPVGHEGDCQ